MYLKTKVSRFSHMIVGCFDPGVTCCCDALPVTEDVLHYHSACVLKMVVG